MNRETHTKCFIMRLSFNLFRFYFIVPLSCTMCIFFALSPDYPYFCKHFQSSALLASRGSSRSKKDVKGLQSKGTGLHLFPLNFIGASRLWSSVGQSYYCKLPPNSKRTLIRDIHRLCYILCVAAGSRPLGDFFPRNLTPAWTVCLSICRLALANKQTMQQHWCACAYVFWKEKEAGNRMLPWA